MNLKESLICPKCSGTIFEMKREAAYLYTYQIDTPLTNPDENEEENLSFLFDNREKISGKEYVECKKCSAKYPCSFDGDNLKIEYTILQKAIRSDRQETPGFLG